MTIAVDASAVVAALVDAGEDGSWATGVLASQDLVAPHLVLAEAANTLRLAADAGQLSADAVSLAHGELLEMPVELFPYYPFAERIWELRGNLTAYDAWYVALAEALQVPLATLDRRLAAVPGPRCGFLMP